MDHRKKKSSHSREPLKKAPPLGLVIALAAAGGVVIGSAGTYFLTKPLAAPKESASAAAGLTPQTPQAPTMPPQNQYTPAPQPPGEAPPGKVWSVEHGHWHDLPATLANPTPAPAVPPIFPAPAPVPANPGTPSTSIPAAPSEKKL